VLIFRHSLNYMHLTYFALYDNIHSGVIQYGNAPKLILREPQSSYFALRTPMRFGEPLHGGGYALFNKMKGVKILCSFQIHIRGPRAECARLGVLGRKEWCDMNCLYTPLLYVCYIRGFNSLCNYDIYYHSRVYKQKT